MNNQEVSTEEIRECVNSTCYDFSDNVKEAIATTVSAFLNFVNS